MPCGGPSIDSLGLEEDVADLGTRLMYSFGLLDIIESAQSTGRDLGEIADLYFVLSERFRVDDLLSKISQLPREDRWQTLARMALRYDLYAALAALTAEVLASTVEGSPEDRVSEWEQANVASIARTRNALGEFGDSRADLAALSVLLRQIRTLVRTASAQLPRGHAPGRLSLGLATTIWSSAVVGRAKVRRNFVVGPRFRQGFCRRRALESYV